MKLLQVYNLNMSCTIIDCRHLPHRNTFARTLQFLIGDMVSYNYSLFLSFFFGSLSDCTPAKCKPISWGGGKRVLGYEDIINYPKKFTSTSIPLCI